MMPGIVADLGLLNTQPALAQAAVANGGQVKVRTDGDVTITGNRLIFNIDSGIRARPLEHQLPPLRFVNSAREMCRTYPLKQEER